jgi:hypothetical protein
MSALAKVESMIPRDQAGWAVLYCRVMGLFALQGLVILALYATMGFDSNPDALPPGLQLDPLHGVIHLVSGIIGLYFGFVRPSGAIRYIQVFAIFYLLLAIFGTFTDIHFGMQLEFSENALHWPLGLIAAAIGFGMLLLRPRTP